MTTTSSGRGSPCERQTGGRAGYPPLAHIPTIGAAYDADTGPAARWVKGRRCTDVASAGCSARKGSYSRSSPRRRRGPLEPSVGQRRQACPPLRRCYRMPGAYQAARVVFTCPIGSARTQEATSEAGSSRVGRVSAVAAPVPRAEDAAGSGGCGSRWRVGELDVAGPGRVGSEGWGVVPGPPSGRWLLGFGGSDGVEQRDLAVAVVVAMVVGLRGRSWS